jgi:hypothetical protein
MQKAAQVVILLSDQNFVPALACEIGCDTGCLAIVRMEDASLQDLADLAIEITDKNTVPDMQRITLVQGRYLSVCR